MLHSLPYYSRCTIVHEKLSSIFWRHTKCEAEHGTQSGFLALYSFLNTLLMRGHVVLGHRMIHYRTRILCKLFALKLGFFLDVQYGHDVNWLCIYLFDFQPLLYSASGSAYLDSQGIDPDMLWWNQLILFAMTSVCCFFTYLQLLRVKKDKWFCLDDAAPD